MNRLAQLSFARFARGLVLLIALLLLLLLGIDILLRAAAMKDMFGWIAEWIPLSDMEQTAYIVLGGLAIVLPLLYMLCSSVEAKLQSGIVGKGTDGEDICLAPEAVEKTIIREIKAQVEEVVRVRSCSAIQGSKAPKVVVQVDVSDRSKVPDVQKKIRSVVEATLGQLIGFADPKQVRVKVLSVKGVAGEKPQRPKKKRPAELPA